MKIDNLKKAIDIGNGVTMASHFAAEIVFPESLRVASNESFSPRNMTIYCQSASIPGTQIATADLALYGPPIKMPYGLIYQDLSLSFICTNSMSQRYVFEEWRRLIVDPTTNYVNYYDKYVGYAFVWKLDQSGKFVYGAVCEEIYPVAILEQELAAQNNDWLRLSVQFSYRRWRGIYDIAAARKAGFESVIPTAPGEDINPGDVFSKTPAPSVPKFVP